MGNYKLKLAMKPLILILEDNETIAYNLKFLLELNNFDVISALNGASGLKTLQYSKRLPDLILCDILMPVMNGYEFYFKVSENPNWSSIPFIFLTAKSDEESIRYGKRLGIDDYITKPFNKEDLISIIEGKIAKNKRIKSFGREYEKRLLKSLNISEQPSLIKENKDDLKIMILFWDDLLGPKLHDYFPKSDDNSGFLTKIAFQLFNTASSIYGTDLYDGSENVLLNIANFKLSAFIHFDHYYDEKVRGNQQLFMIGVIAPKLNYLESLLIDKAILPLSDEIKQKVEYSIEDYWENILELLSTPKNLSLIS